MPMESTIADPRSFTKDLSSYSKPDVDFVAIRRSNFFSWVGYEKWEENMQGRRFLCASKFLIQIGKTVQHHVDLLCTMLRQYSIPVVYDRTL